MFMKRFRGAGTVLIVTSAPTALAPLRPARLFSSSRARTRFSAQEPCSYPIKSASKFKIHLFTDAGMRLTCHFSTPNPLYLAGSQAGISVSCTPPPSPPAESSTSVKIGSRRFVTSVSFTLGRRCKVAARECDILINSIGGAWAAFCAFQAW